MLMQRKVIWLSLVLAASSATHYGCLPYPEKSRCIIDSIHYDPGGEPITFPYGYDHYRILSRSEKHILSNIAIFDKPLYEAMHRPSRIEMANVHLEKLILPPTLHLGNFAGNNLTSVTTENRKNYQISYLNLQSNRFKEITFVSVLVNLEVLHLGYNDISTIPGSVLAPLTKLKYLYLQQNSFTSIPWTDLPHTLIHLDCFSGEVKSAEFTKVRLPSLEYLNLQYNSIATINLTALLRVAPRLKEAHLNNAHMTELERDQIAATLTANNISFIDSPWLRGFCISEGQYEYKDGLCVRRKSATGKAILLTGVIIVTAATFVYIAVLTFKHMNRL